MLGSDSGNPEHPEAIPPLVEKALALHDQGRLTEAEHAYEAILLLDPQHFVATHQLGVIQNQRGAFDSACEFLGKALRMRPRSAVAHFNMGIALWNLHRPDEALAHYQYALALNPKYPEALLNCAVVLQALHRPEEALLSLESLLRDNPGFPPALLNAGIILLELKRYKEALTFLDRVLASNPQSVEGLMSRGNALLGTGRLEEALESFDQALVLQPDGADILVNRGNALLDLERFQEALASYDRAIALRPDHVEALSSRSIALRKLNRPVEGLQSCERALALAPDNPDVLLNHGTALFALARPEEALASLEKALSLRPNFPAAHSNKIFILDYLPEAGFREHQAARKAFFEQQASSIAIPASPFPNDRNPSRKLVLGYVSSDFKHHSAALCFGPVLKHHDKHQFRVICYSGVIHEDGWTQAFKAHADAWRSTLGLSDEDLALQIQEDRVDILIDLSGHSQDSRLLILASKPAPIQVTAWGNGGGTGFPMIDYQFTDPVSTPEWARPLFAEASYDLPCFITFEPPASIPPVQELPASTRGFITFGCLNRFNKITPSLLALWAKILSGVPGSRLLLKNAAIDEPSTRNTILKTFLDRGIASDRIEMRGATSQEEHLAAYSEVDIVLDTFPQNGGITTWEALWMGVPVLTVKGNKPPSLISAAILHSQGLDSWVGADEAEYGSLALEKAADLDALVTFRRGIRERIKASPAGNPELYTQAVEAAYRTMWLRWLEQGSAQPTA